MVRNLKSNTLVCGWVAISQYIHQRRYKNNGLVFQALIYYNETEVDRMETYSGITEEMMRNGMDFDFVRKEIIYFLENYTVVGVNIKADLDCLKLTRYVDNCIDLHSYNGLFKDTRLRSGRQSHTRI